MWGEIRRILRHPCPRKLFAGCKFVRGSGAIFIEFRSGGGAILVPGGAKLVRHDGLDRPRLRPAAVALCGAKSPRILVTSQTPRRTTGSYSLTTGYQGAGAVSAHAAIISGSVHTYNTLFGRRRRAESGEQRAESQTLRADG
jgi:hypothetical protein